MKINYRPELDGLRAIAVISVILYHAKISIFGYQVFKGGFIGVDIFFVISGYLISSIILKELIITGSFSLKYFYERRIRRILPILLLVMLASLPIAWMYLMPKNFVDLSKSLLYSLGFSSNFYFHYTNQEYGAVSALFIPLLHTWSLSVETQYYILFPIVLIIAFKYFRKYLLNILVICLILSLIMANWGSRNYVSATFYLLHARMWEFLFGSILAYFHISIDGGGGEGRWQYKSFQILNKIFPAFGLFLICHSVLLFNDKILHPSFYTLSPVIGVCLIIWFSKNDLIAKILSTKLFVGIGLISYSLYLWHYPIFAFARITEFSSGDLFKQILLLIIIVILSIISYYLIELPARNRNIKFKYIIIFIIIFIFFLIISSLNIIYKKGHKSRLPEIFNKDLSDEASYHLLKNSVGAPCHGQPEGCKFNTSSIKKIYLIGDSHMASLSFDLKNRVVKKNYQFIQYTVAGCIYYPGFNLVEIKTLKINKSCSDNNFNKLKQILLNDKNSIIIFGGRHPYYLTWKKFDNQEGAIEPEIWVDVYNYNSVGKYINIADSFKNEVLELANNNTIILIYSIPEVGWDVPRKLLNLISTSASASINLSFKNYISTSYQVYKNRNKSTFETLDSIKSDNIYRVYPHTLFCNTIIKNRCLANDDKNIFYSDDDHPSIKGSEMINDLIIKEIEKIETKTKSKTP